MFNKVLPVILLFNSLSFGQPSPQKRESVLLCKTLNEKHIDPPAWDDKLSRQIFSDFINTLDRRHLLFTQADIKELEVYQNSLDDELTGNDWKFVPFITELYKKRVAESENIFNEILLKPFNLNLEETISFNVEDSLTFPADKKELVLRWTKWLKYQTLVQLIAAGKNDQSDKELLAKEPEIRLKVKTRQIRKIKKILQHPEGVDNYLTSIYFNTITACFDPHSAYFSKSDWEYFEGALSDEALSFGMDLEEDDAGNIVVSRLIPGGPAWKSGELHKGDILVEMKWAGKEPVDLLGADLEEVEGLIASSNSVKMDISVKQPDGFNKKVTLAKEKLRQEENIVKSYILNNASKKIGYISLPGFYTEWENAEGRGCANDVAKEIIKLKAEDIEGLILDIRSNGGGSLLEGSNLAGIFIDEGPLFMLKGKDGKVVVMKDPNRGTIYDGPLVLMVNGQSASASEILASTLQDYNRAVIVGSNTYGKATGQSVNPLNPYDEAKRSAQNDIYGHVTVTGMRIYRINGGSAQIRGVTPDIHLPEIFENFDYKERSLPFALPNDSLVKKPYYIPFAALPYAILSERSKKRLAGSESFMAIANPVDLSFFKSDKDIPLNLGTYRTKIQKSEAWWDQVEKASALSANTFSVQNSAYDKEAMKVDPYGSEINQMLMQNLLEDIYLEETFQVIDDLINFTKNK